MSSDAEEQPSEDRQKYEFKKVIEELQEYEGSGTQLVTIYIPDDKQISSVMDHVIQEHSEASNIKSKQTRTNVQDALKSIKDRLRYYDTYPPENGIVIFSDRFSTWATFRATWFIGATASGSTCRSPPWWC